MRFLDLRNKILSLLAGLQKLAEKQRVPLRRETFIVDILCNLYCYIGLLFCSINPMSFSNRV